ncbi:MAG TPA: DUF4031 domain-containing protein [Rhodanobacteraceae bacterium]|nr:DUF4031 domain-containing protein [Rhodanobacteraceae bacterium]
MSVYVDAERIQWRDRLWCHLVADSLCELHAFAASLGLKRRWFQDGSFYPHYDVTIGVRRRALRLGAVDADRNTIVDRSKTLRRELLAQRGNCARLNRDGRMP